MTTVRRASETRSLTVRRQFSRHSTSSTPSSSKSCSIFHTGETGHRALLHKDRSRGESRMSETKAHNDAPVAENVSGHSTAAPPRERKAGGGVLKRLKSRRSQVESRPVTEEDLRDQTGPVVPEDVLGLRVATRGLNLCVQCCCCLCRFMYLNSNTLSSHKTNGAKCIGLSRFAIA